jgi:acetyl esterase
MAEFGAQRPRVLRMPLDPRAQRFLDRLAAMNPQSALALSVAERRAALAELLGFAGTHEPVECIEDRSVPGAESELTVRIYTPAQAQRAVLPGLVYFHGGGFVAGTLDSHDGICRSLANASACRLISVGYRLAPEHPFPAGIADGWAVMRWVATHAAELSVDPRCLAVGGDSAGAMLAAVIAQLAARTRDVRLALQVLLCPLLDVHAATESRRLYATGYFLDQATLDHDLRYYLGAGAERDDPRISPLRAAELRHLPPTVIHTAEFDPVRDEGQVYAQRLEHAGVPTLYRCHSGMIHLFYGMGALIPYAAEAYRQIGADIASLLTAKGNAQ